MRRQPTASLSRIGLRALATVALVGPLVAAPLQVSSADPVNASPTTPVTGSLAVMPAHTDLCGSRPGPARYRDATGSATVSIVRQGADCRRTYRLVSTVSGTREFTEPAGLPRVRTGSALVDGMYAMSMEEARLNRASSLTDAAYNDEKPVACSGGCYVTGANWPYVWTRDAAYAADLGLTAIDPQRMRNTLAFKLSERRDRPGGVEILQDTGTGGSYPNSTDRVAWVLGAAEVLDWLPTAERDPFAARVYDAVRTTVEHDRKAVFDSKTMLYRGETSFLDWREQTYPDWTAKDVTDVTTSMSMSTNLTHWVALDAASRLGAASGQASAARRYRGWADDLARSIRSTFWRADKQQFSHVLPNALDPTPVARYDALATSLAVITGVATPAQARAAVATYPQTTFGPPVVWPQQQGVPSYHNNAIWPFVTAYVMRAAARTGNDAVATAGADSLLRGAALYGSHMENINLLDGGIKTEMNSKRQLWSIGGMQSMVQQTLFGLDARPDGLHVAPFVPAQLHRQLFAANRTLRLEGLSYRGKSLSLSVELPRSAAANGAYAVESISLDGRVLATDTAITERMLRPGSHLTVRLGAPGAAAGAVRLVDRTSAQALYGPTTPAVTAVERAGASGARLHIDLGKESARRVSMTVNRDGRTVARNIPATATWTDPSAAADTQSPCYTVSLAYRSSGNASQDSRVRCFWGVARERVTTIGAEHLQAVGGRYVADRQALPRYARWGTSAGDRLTARFTPVASGQYLVQAQYALDGPINTGITGAVKMLSVLDDRTGRVVAQEVVALPHTGAANAVNGSTFARARLRAGTPYRLVLHNDPAAINMTYFRSNALHKDARSGPVNEADVVALQVLFKGL